MELKDERATAELRRLNAEADKLEAEAEKLKAEVHKLSPEALKVKAEAGKLEAETRRYRHNAITDIVKSGLAVFAAIIAAYKFADSLGWL